MVRFEGSSRDRDATRLRPGSITARCLALPCGLPLLALRLANSRRDKRRYLRYFRYSKSDRTQQVQQVRQVQRAQGSASFPMLISMFLAFASFARSHFALCPWDLGLGWRWAGATHCGLWIVGCRLWRRVLARQGTNSKCGGVCGRLPYPRTASPVVSFPTPVFRFLFPFSASTLFFFLSFFFASPPASIFYKRLPRSSSIPACYHSLFLVSSNSPSRLSHKP